ncbi:diguanylate cyclase domain-containing protein [Tepidibacter aestuarii]|uniref:diguanylate cyclase domain-containing protein n=1 Tax=Tepidibacter aestuarii TaxID=2925782 RepID=UPI0020BFC12F|nr:diguanylate cyclase [Tepidibacter aestuarii]CAH2214404.1 Stage 0 sporulation protein A homolog [Tepidibacter aestuarii]
MNKEIQILVVEDSLTQAEQLKFILEKRNYKVIIANDGVQALEYINKFIPDLVVTDILMPNMDGYKLCQKIKEDYKLSHIPVILLTSLSDPIDVIKGLKVKADNFITKPYNEKFLLSRIQHMLINVELRKNKIGEMGIEVFFAGEKHFINSERIQIIDLLLSTFENAVQKSKELENANDELKKAFETIRKLEKNYRGILESNTDALVVINHYKKILYLNPAANKLFGENYEELIFDILDFDEIKNGIKETTINDRHGNQIIGEVCISETGWEGKDAYLLSIRDTTEKVRLREKLKIQSLTDELTSLYNRRGFFSIVEHKIKFAKRNRKGMVLFFIDIDGMKVINDNLSHIQGDCALVGASNILKNTFNENDVLARIGGDEFAALCMDVDEQYGKELINKLLDKQMEFNNKNDHPFNISMSIGYAYFDPENPIDIKELIARADKLMYEYKKGKRSI